MTKSNVLLSVGGVVLLAGIAAGFAWLWLASSARDSGTGVDDVMTRLMKLKTAAITDVREGLDQSDLGRAERGVTELRRIGAASNWYLPDQRYSRQSDQFRQALEQLGTVLAARDLQQLPGAYSALVDSCAACHQQAAASPLDPATLRQRSISSPP